MFEQLIYINHLGRSIVFDSKTFGKTSGYLLGDDPPLTDWEFKYDSTSGKVTNIYQDVQTREFTVSVVADSNEEANSLKNNLYDVLSADVMSNGKYGKFVYGDYILNCVITASQKVNYFEDEQFADYKLKVTTDKPYWLRTFTQLELDPNNTGEINLPADTLPYWRHYLKITLMPTVEQNYLSVTVGITNSTVNVFFSISRDDTRSV